MAGNRWRSWKSAAPLWGTGVILIVLGVALVAAGRKAAR